MVDRESDAWRAARDLIRDASWDDVLELLRGTPHYPAALLGGMIRSENPYFPEDEMLLTEQAIMDRIKCGQFATMDANHPYNPDNDGPIPTPLDRGSDTWHYSTRIRPKEIPDSPRPDLNARTVVKEIEITYAPNVPGTPAGEERPPHLVILYSGGNSGGP